MKKRIAIGEEHFAVGLGIDFTQFLLGLSANFDLGEEQTGSLYELGIGPIVFFVAL